ncbi:MAG: sugar ABC transporter substrate-binding protein [Pseudomonadota bacterium]
MKNNLWGYAAAGALGVALASSPAAAENLQIVVVTHGQAASAFWSVAQKGVEDADADFDDVDVSYQAPEGFNMVQMGQIIDAAVASNPDGLVVSIPDAESLGDAIRNAVASGIPVISMNSGSDVRKDLGVMVHVGQTEYEAGLGGGERWKDAGITNAACVNVEVGNVALDLRCEGFAEGLGQEVEVIPVQIGDPTQMRNAVAAYMASHPDLEGLFVLGQDGAMPTLEAVEEGDKLGQIKVATFDLSDEVLMAIDEGKMDFAIDQQQYMQGYLPVVLLRLYNKTGVMPGADVLTGPGFVTKDNAANVIDWAKEGVR